ncbi:MAG: hypothetical protein PHF34_08890, partial [Bacteroidales bacterium]|nr:hypothetical protein [Bacteroidales bacterium]
WNNKELSWNDALRLLEKISKNEKLLTTKNVKSSVLSIYKSMKEGGNPDLNHKITRLEMAVLMDKILDPFNNKQVDIYGAYIKK